MALNSTAQAEQSALIVNASYTVKVGGSTISQEYVISYRYLGSINSQMTASVVFMNNATTRAFSEGDVLEIKESAGGTEYNRFYGKIHRINNDVVGIDEVITVEGFDSILFLKNEDIEYSVEGSTGRISNETVDPHYDDNDSEHFHAEISAVTSTSITVTNVSNPELLASFKGINVLYNFGQVDGTGKVTTGRRTFRTVTAWNGSDTITTTKKTDSWAVGDIITNRKDFILFDLAQTGIDKNSVSLKLKARVDDVEYPSLSDHEIYADSGQILLGTSLNVQEFYLIGSYKYYTAGLYVEDIIESIILAADGYGNNSISSGDLQTTYQAVEGAGATDSLYGSGNTWYTRYNNIQGSLGSGDFSITGGSFSSFDERSGVLTTSGSPSAVTCTANYTFKTIQATGVSVPYAYFTKRTMKNKLQAIQKLLKLVVQPNYRLYTLGTKAIWAKYLTQTSLTGSYHNKIYTPTLFRYFDDDDVYTRVALWARNTNPNNIIGDASLLLPTEDIVEVTDDTLTWEGFSPDYHYAIFRPSQENRIYADDDTIDLKISGSSASSDTVEHYRERILGMSGPNDEGNYIITLSSWNIYIRSTLNNSVFFYYINIDGDWVLVESSNIIDIYDNVVVVNIWDPEEAKEDLYATYWTRLGNDITEINDWWVDYKNARFYVNADYLTWVDRFNEIVPPFAAPYQHRETVTADYKYHTIGADWGTFISKSWLLSDGSPVTQVARYYWTEPNNNIFCYLAMNTASIVDSVVIGGGVFYPRTTNRDFRQFTIHGKYKLEYSSGEMFSSLLKSDITAAATTIDVYNAKNLSSLSNGDTLIVGGESLTYNSHVTANGVTTLTVSRSSPVAHTNLEGFTVVYKQLSFSSICTELDEFDLSSNQILEIGRDKLGDALSVGTFKLTLVEAQPVTFSNIDNDGSNSKTIYPAAIHTFKAYENSFLMKEATLVSSVTDSSSQVLDSNSLRSKIGDKVFKKSFGDDTFIKEEDLQALAKNLLEEYVKNHGRVKTEELYNPSLFIGQTVRVTDDTFSSIDQNYFVEEVEGAGGPDGIAHVISLAQFAG